MPHLGCGTKIRFCLLDFALGFFWIWMLLPIALMSHNIALVFVLSSLSRTVSLSYFLQTTLLMNLGRETDSTYELPREDQICNKVTYSAGQILNILYNNARAN